MLDEETGLMRQECRVARRLTRLFHIEHSGRLGRLPLEFARRLTDRRGTLISELLRLEERRRSFEPWTPTELDLVMGALAKEVGRAEQRCLERLAELGAELRRRRGEGMATGLREGGDGRLLGRG